MKALILSLFLGLSLGHAIASPIHKIVVFGDSLSDTGNIYAYTKHQYPPSPPYYKGRLSNGPVWIEHVLEHYYPGTAEAHHLNYAFGGAGVSSEEEDKEDDEIDDGAAFNLTGQIKRYLKTHNDTADASSLYVIWIGANNYVFTKNDLDEAVDLTISGIQRNIDLMLQKGMKHIMVINLPELGVSPKARELDSEERLSSVAHQHNMKLEIMLEALRQQHPDVDWLAFNVSPLFLDVIHHPSTYGLTNVRESCQKTEADLTHCNEYLFFDSSHLSARAHESIGKHIITYLETSGVHFQ